MKKVIIISGANLYTGGPLSIIQAALAYLDAHLSNDYNIIALVHSKKDFKQLSCVKLIEVRAIRKSYFHRLYYEYYRYRFISKRLKPYLWFSLNDMSSVTTAERKAVYCHNPAPFHKLTFSDISDEPSLFFFTLFYKLIYRINIHQNRYIIVQQEWIRKWFVKMFCIASQKIIVSPPAAAASNTNMPTHTAKNFTKIIFLFPARPRPFKNIEVIGEAVKQLPAELNGRYEIIITIKGTENGYAKRMVQRYGCLDSMQFIGFVSQSEMLDLYIQASCLLFPSRLETWGLPISEWKTYDKPMLVAERPYSRETVGDYKKAAFFAENDSTQLARLMQDVVQGTVRFSPTATTEYTSPVAHNWQQLFDYLLK